MMKLLISCATLGSGGAERVISILSKPFADSFDEVILVTWLKAPSFYSVDNRVRTISLPDISGKRNRYSQIRSFRKLVVYEQPSVILSFLTPFSVLVVISLLGIRIPIIACERTDPDRIYGIKKFVRNLFYKNVSGILTQTYESKRSISKSLIGKTSVIYNPVVMELNVVGSAVHAKKDKLIVTAGRLIPLKNHKLMIDAFQLVKLSHPDYKLVIYGEGPEREKLQTYIDSLNLSKSVLLPGNQTDLWTCLKPACVFLLTSLYEGMPNALIEAMCLGLPCVSTRIKAASELIIDGENGYIVNNNSPLSFAEKICEVIDNPGMAKVMGMKASEIYSILRDDIISKQWVSYIYSICSMEFK